MSWAVYAMWQGPVLWRLWAVITEQNRRETNGLGPRSWLCCGWGAAGRPAADTSVCGAESGLNKINKLPHKDMQQSALPLNIQFVCLHYELRQQWGGNNEVKVGFSGLKVGRLMFDRGHWLRVFSDCHLLMSSLMTELMFQNVAEVAHIRFKAVPLEEWSTQLHHYIRSFFACWAPANNWAWCKWIAAVNRIWCPRLQTGLPQFTVNFLINK